VYHGFDNPVDVAPTTAEGDVAVSVTDTQQYAVVITFGAGASDQSTVQGACPGPTTTTSTVPGETTTTTTLGLGSTTTTTVPPPVVIVAPPAAFDVAVTVDAVGPGIAVANGSPPLADGSAVTATADGLSRDDIALIGRETAKAYCFLKTTRSVVKAARQHQGLIQQVQQNAERYDRFLEKLGVALLFDFADCLAFANAVVDREVAAGGTAVWSAARPAAPVASSTTCPITPIRIALQHKHGQTLPRAFKIAPVKGLTMSCTFDGGVWTLHIASKSGKPLRKLIGDRLLVGVVRSPNDPPGGQLTFSYHLG